MTRNLPLYIVVRHVRDVLNDSAAGVHTVCPSLHGFGLHPGILLTGSHAKVYRSYTNSLFGLPTLAIKLADPAPRGSKNAFTVATPRELRSRNDWRDDYVAGRDEVRNRSRAPQGKTAWRSRSDPVRHRDDGDMLTQTTMG